MTVLPLQLAFDSPTGVIVVKFLRLISRGDMLNTRTDEAGHNHLQLQLCPSLPQDQGHSVGSIAMDPTTSFGHANSGLQVGVNTGSITAEIRPSPGEFHRPEPTPASDFIVQEQPKIPVVEKRR